MRRRRQHIEEDHDSEERWLVSYADFITLLFAFFALMYSVSSVNEGKYRVMSDAIVEAFNEDSKNSVVKPIKQPIKPPISSQFVEGYNVANGSNSSESADAIINLNDTNSDSLIDLNGKGESIVGQGQDDGNYNVEFDVEEELLEEQQARQLENIAQQLNNAMQEQIDDDAVSINHSDDFIEVEINNKILFPSGSAYLSRKALPVLTSLAGVFSSFTNNIQVEGFTDNEPIRTAAFPSNWELSAARAASVVHLLSKAGIDPKRMVAMGYGEYRPVADNATEEGRQKNRRVVIVIPTIDQGGFQTQPGKSRSGFSGQKRVEVGS